MKVCIYYLIVIDPYNSQLLLSLHYIKRNIQKAQHPTHPLHKLTIHPHTPRLKKQHIQQHQLHHQHITPRHSHTTTYLSKLTKIHTSIVQTHLLQRNHNKLIHQHAPKISSSELSLPRETRPTLAQLPTNKSPILLL